MIMGREVAVLLVVLERAEIGAEEAQRRVFAEPGTQNLLFRDGSQ
jgi:hypothetical protein